MIALVLSVMAVIAQLASSTPSGAYDHAAELHLRAEIVAEHDRLCRSDLLPAASTSRTLALARYRSRDMAVYDYFSHVDRLGRHLPARLAAWGITYHYAGEILAWNNYPAEQTAEGAYQQFLGSPSHIVLIRDCNFTRVAVAAYRLGYKTVYTVLFRQPR